MVPYGTIKTCCFQAKRTLVPAGNKQKSKVEMLNYKNQQKNLGRTGGAANSKIWGLSSWTNVLQGLFGKLIL